MSILSKIKSFMTPDTKPTDPFSDDRPEMEFSSSMDATTSNPPPPQLAIDTFEVDSDTKEVVGMFGLLKSPQRIAFVAAIARQWCLGCGNELPKSGGVCKTCNGD